MHKKSLIPISFLCAVPFIMVLGNSMLIPVLPKIKDALHISQLRVSLLITLFSIPAGLTIPLAGFLSDRISRKSIISLALLVYGTGGLVAGGASILMKASAYPLIIGGRVLQGIGAAGTAPIAMALTSDIFTSNERSKVLGMLEAGNGLGKVVSPVLGSLIGLLAWWAVFFLFPVLCLPVSLGIWFLIKDPKTKKQPQPVKEYLQALKRIFRTKGVSLVMAFLAGSTVLFILFGVLFYLSDHLETKYGIEGVKKGFIIAIPVLAMALTSYLSGLVTQKKTGMLKPMVITGMGLLSVSMAVAPFFQNNTIVLLAALVVSGIGTGLVLPCLNTLITGSCSMEERGMVTSLYGGVRFFGVAGGPPVFGLLMGHGAALTFLTPALLALAVGAANLFFLKQEVLNKESTGQGKDKEVQGKSLLQKVLITAKIDPAPQLRPQAGNDTQATIMERVLHRIEPALVKTVEEEVRKEIKNLEESITREVKEYVRDSVKVQVQKNQE